MASSTSSADSSADWPERPKAATQNPPPASLDTQSVKTSANVPAAGQGIDAGKRIAGRERHIGVDTETVAVDPHRERFGPMADLERLVTTQSPGP